MRTNQEYRDDFDGNPNLHLMVGPHGVEEVLLNSRGERVGPTPVYQVRANISPVCVFCKRIPRDIPEYVEMAEITNSTPEQFVKYEEGTYNPQNGHFACTDCYIEQGMPTSQMGWKAP